LKNADCCEERRGDLKLQPGLFSKLTEPPVVIATRKDAVWDQFNRARKFDVASEFRVSVSPLFFTTSKIG
jgi:hypothetical protein